MQTQDQKMRDIGFKPTEYGTYQKTCPEGYAIHVIQEAGGWRASLRRYGTLDQESPFLAASPDVAATHAMKEYWSAVVA